MDRVKIFVENWPETDLVYQIVPIIVAVSALVVSLYTAYLSRSSFEMASRPYLSAHIYTFLTNDNSAIPSIDRIKYELTNAPTKIVRNEIRVLLGGELVFEKKEENLVWFPMNNGEIVFSISKQVLEEILEAANKSKLKLEREILVKYQPLNLRKTYEYVKVQEFDLINNQWLDVSTKST
ncbi:hypothetical protein HPX47_001170 [Vibrio alginolyticus]|nr:hypothetical protein [Vibrio alginolyticus]